MDTEHLINETKNSLCGKHSKRMQVCVCLLIFVSCLALLFVIETRLTEQQRRLEFAYQEYYLRPFHYKLDPFSYVELKNGVPITQPEPPNPHFIFSFEELLLNRFIDYFMWIQGPSDETDVTTDADRIDVTIQALGAHLRNRLYYQLERDELKINPILLTPPEIPKDPKKEDFIEPNKLVWNVIPYCSDPVLEEALHELGNINGFLYARGNHKNFRFLNGNQTEKLGFIVANVPIKHAYLHHHNFINFTRLGLKSPIQISMICEPIQKKIRHFYTERYNYKEWSEDFPIAGSKWWKQSLEECMNQTENRECRYKGLADIKRTSSLDIGRVPWLPRRVEWTSPQFCEYDRCLELGVEKDLEYVKNVVQNEYAVVGILEKLDETLDLLEAKVPHFFKGIKDVYYKKLATRPNDSPGPEIPEISPQMRTEMEARYAPEIEFYRFVSDRFQREIDNLQRKL